MLFLAEFSFSGRHHGNPLEGQEISGHFNCLVEAADVDGADRALRSLLTDTRRRHDVFDGIEEVYLDALVAVKSVPKKGLLTFFAEHFEAMPDTIWSAAPYAGARYCESYSFGEEEEGRADEEHAETVPYLVFQRPRGN